MQVPFSTCDLLGVRRKPLADISNGMKNNIHKLQMVEAEKAIAESMFINSLKEKEMMRAQTIKTINLLKNQLARSEHNLSNANSTIIESEIRLEEDLKISITRDHKINELQNEVTTLKDSFSRVNSTIAQHELQAGINQDQQISMDKQINGQRIEYSDAVNSLGEAKKAVLDMQCLLDESNRRISDLNNTLKDSDDSSSNLTLLLSDARRTISELTISLDDANQLSSDLKELLSDADYRISELTDVNLTYQKENLINQNKMNDLDSKIIDLNNRILNMTAAMISTNEAHAPVIVSMHLEREQFASRLFSLEAKLLDVNVQTNVQIENQKEKENLSQEALLELEKYLETKFNDISAMMMENENLKVQNMEILKMKNNFETLNEENSKNFNHRILLLKKKLGAKTLGYNVISALQRTHTVDLAEAMGGMQYDSEKLNEKIVDLKEILKSMEKEMILIKAEKYSFEVEVGIRTNELFELTSSLTDLEDDKEYLISKISYLDEKIEDFKNEIIVLKDKNLILENNNTTQESDNKVLNNDFNILYNSKLELETEMKNHVNNYERDIAIEKTNFKNLTFSNEEEIKILIEKNQININDISEKNDRYIDVMTNQHNNEKNILIQQKKKECTAVIDLWEILKEKEVENEVEKLNLNDIINCLEGRIWSKESEIDNLIIENVKLKTDFDNSFSMNIELNDKNENLILRELNTKNDNKLNIENVEKENISNFQSLQERDIQIQILLEERKSQSDELSNTECSLTYYKNEAVELKDQIEQVQCVQSLSFNYSYECV